MLLGVYCFLRRWRLRRDAALLGGVMFTFSGFCLLHFVHVNCVAVVAHVPWLLLAIDIAMREPKPHGADGWPARRSRSLTGSQILLGYPQVVAMSLVLEARLCGADATPCRQRCRSRFVAEAPPERKMARPAIVAIISVLFWKALGFAIGGAQLLPTFEAIGQSSRQTCRRGIPRLGLVGSTEPDSIRRAVFVSIARRWPKYA